MKLPEFLKKNYIIIISLIAFFLIIFLWLLNWSYFKDFSDAQRGTYGDMFGVTNSLFSGLALTGIIITIMLQSKELSLQRQELSATRLEFNIQNQTLKLQRFENTFFNLLSIHHQIVNSMDYDVKKRHNKDSASNIQSQQINKVKGRDVFKHTFDELESNLIYTEDITFVKSIYLKFYARHQTDFGHYFRNLYRIIKLVDSTQFSESLLSKAEQNDEYLIKYNYTCMIRAQLSDYELLWLFYNCLSLNGIEKFKPLVERYALFKNIPRSRIPNEKILELYAQSAFRRIEAEE
jgi:hypothetical protein